MCGKMGVDATLAPKALGPQDPTKKWAHWVDLLGRSTVISKTCFYNFRARTPPPYQVYNQYRLLM